MLTAMLTWCRAGGGEGRERSIEHDRGPIGGAPVDGPTGPVSRPCYSRRREMSANGRHGPVGDLLSPAVAMILPTATLRAAVEAMAADGLGLLVVAEASGPIGVLSERDIVAAIAEDLDLAEERVRDHCNDEIVAVDVAASVEDAARAMADAQIRHLAVTREGQVVGVVSVRDVLRILVS